MAKLPTDLSGRRLRAVLERAGFVFVRQKCSHMILRNGSAWVVVPDHRTVKPGTLRGIIADASLTVDDFVDPFSSLATRLTADCSMVLTIAGKLFFSEALAVSSQSVDHETRQYGE